MIRALSYATNSTIIALTSITIIAEKNVGLKNTLTTLGGHHWVGKGIVGILLYVTMFLLFQYVFKSTRENTDRNIYSMCIVSVVCMLVLPVFFILEYAHIL